MKTAFYWGYLVVLICGTALAAVSCIHAIGDLSPRRAQMDDPGLSWPPVICSQPCVIKESAGGVIDYFVAEAQELKATRTLVIVDGLCASACTILVDIDRDNACLTPNALLAYHQSAMTEADGTPKYGQISFDTPGLNAYIAARGGLPRPDSGHMLMLGYHEALRFYRACSGVA